MFFQINEIVKWLAITLFNITLLMQESEQIWVCMIT